MVETPKHVTVRPESDGWYVSVQCEFELKPVISSPHLNTAVGLDMGVKRVLTLNDGSFIKSLEERLKPLEDKIGLLQRKIKHKVKGSNNLKQAYLKPALLHQTSDMTAYIKSQPNWSKTTTCW